MSAGGRKVVYRMVQVTVWNADLRGATDPAIAIYMRLWTGPESSPIPGVVLMGRAAIAEALGWSLAKRPPASGGRISISNGA